MFAAIVLIIILVAPTVIAHLRGHHSRFAITVLDTAAAVILLGYCYVMYLNQHGGDDVMTLFGLGMLVVMTVSGFMWFFALIWSFTSVQKTQQ